MLLFMSLGSFIFEEELNDAIRTVCKNYPTLQKASSRRVENKASNYNCCIIHLLDTLSGTNNTYPEISLDLPLYRSARKRFSESLQDLMCGCLRFNQSSRFKLEDISIHRFLLQCDSNSRIELKDLMHLMRSEKSNLT
jgi:hypothetical protein